MTFLRKSLPLPSPLARDDDEAVKTPAIRLSISEDEEPRVKKQKTSETRTSGSAKLTTALASSTASMAPPEVPATGRGSRKSKMAAALHLKDASFDDSGVFAAPAPPKPKAAPKKKKESAKKKAEEEGESG